MDNAVDKKFREALSHHKVTPSPDLWAKLDKELDQKKSVGRRKWIYYAVAAVLILMIGLPGINYFLISEGHITYSPRTIELSLNGDETLESGLPFTIKQVKPSTKPTIKTTTPISQNTQSKLAAIEVETAPIITEEQKPKKVIRAYVRPLAATQTSIIEGQTLTPESTEKITKQKWTVGRAFEKIMAIKNGDVKLPKNIILNVPKPELFASK